MGRFAIVIAVLGACPAGAESFKTLMGAEIEAALTGRALVYQNGATQDFRASGRTLYNTGQDSWGYWGVRGDQYCSMWPPSDLWACYDVAVFGQTVRFIGAQGDVTDGVYDD